VIVRFAMVNRYRVVRVVSLQQLRVAHRCGDRIKVVQSALLRGASAMAATRTRLTKAAVSRPQNSCEVTRFGADEADTQPKPECIQMLV
jgi:hypothetical protein